MYKYRISDLLDMALIQKLADLNFRASGMPMTIIDAVDVSILVKAGWPRICDEIHRLNPLSSQRCMESDRYLDEHIKEQESFQYRCKNGLWHIGIPIVVQGKHLATLFLSQFWFEGEAPDQEYFIQQAREFHCDINNYLAEINRVPIFSKEKVDHILAYYKMLAHIIGDLAEQSYQMIETKRSLAESEEKYRTLVNNANIGIFRTVPGSGRPLHSNPAMARMFGYDSVEEFMSIDEIDLYVNIEDRARIEEDVKRNGVIRSREFAMKKKDHTPIWCSATITAVYNENGDVELMDGVIEDITTRKKTQEDMQIDHDQLEARIKNRTVDLAKTNELLLSEIAERKRIEEKLRELSETDSLTMIYNRRKLLEIMTLEVEKAHRHARQLSLIMIDVDSFKKINDKQGHNVGDVVLKTSANVISNILRKIDTFARYGGDEFIVMTPEASLEGALIVAEKIRASIEQHDYPDVGRVTVSVGVAELSKTDTGATLIAKADEALYAAKKKGRNKVEPFLLDQTK
jgi:diguanylate cyclase (GGDEF)-like protein/PAS domain S-box-containing protein